MDQDLIPPRFSSRSSQTSVPAHSQTSPRNSSNPSQSILNDAAQQDIATWNINSNSTRSRAGRDYASEIAWRGQPPRRDLLLARPSVLNTIDPLPRPENHRSGSSDSVTSATRKRVASGAADNPYENKRTQSSGSTGSTSQNSRDRLGSSVDRPIDLTGMSPGYRAATQRPPQYSPSAMNLGRESVQLPPWQPDAEVTSCPVCGMTFGFLYRKHHCRKCGRVVCDNCSRHRIGLPRQYIVQPPAGVSSSPFMSTITALGMPPNFPGGPAQPSMPNQAYSHNHTSPPLMAQPAHLGYMGGAEVVRVCNPCVPDPNLSPPPQTPVSGTPQPYAPTAGAFPLPGGHIRPLDSRNMTASQSHNFNAPLLTPNSTQPPVTIPQRRGSGLQGFGTSNLYQPLPAGDDQNYSSMGSGSRLHSHARPQRRPATNFSPPPNLMSQSGLMRPPVSSEAPPHRSSSLNPDGSQQAPAGSSMGYRRQVRTQAASAQPIQPARRDIPEEDECPVCSRELPPLGPNNDTKAREAHIETCIQHHSYSSSTPPTAVPSQQASSSVGANPSSQATSQFHAGFRQTPTVLNASRPSATEPTPQASSLPSLPIRPSRSRMIVYSASEKDCTGDDGEAQECIICFEEFEPGAQMGRLECWCKFHKVCITQWWETKGPGSCPLHQLHG